MYNYLSDQRIYVRDPEVFKNCDIVFKFMGNDKKVVDFRCDAQKFLVSPLKTDAGYIAPFWEQDPPSSLDQPFSVTLGMVSAMTMLPKATPSLTCTRTLEFLLDSYLEA